MKYFPLITLFLFGLASAQNQRVLEVEVNGIEVFQFDLEAVAHLNIQTHEENKIVIEVFAEGEYQDELFFTESIVGEVFQFSTNADILLQDGFDKLSAMKVFAVEINIKLPTSKRVEINSTSASVYGNGKFFQLDVSLKNGSIELSPFEGNAHLSTYTGNIFLATSDAKVVANSRNGIVDVVDFDFEDNYVEITTVDGNIEVKQIVTK